ncbi:hypothetical protein QTP88_000467 [Uroleucon formosanum]
MKQYMPMKPIKRGFKVWALADSASGYLINFEIYTGKNSNNLTEFGLGENVVLNLSQYLEMKFHCIYFDNFFTSLPLAEKLLNNDIFSCGTFRINKKYYPKDLMKKDSLYKPGDIEFAQCDDISICRWKDRGSKPVTVISSMHDASHTEIVHRKNSRDTEVHCDASQLGLGAILLQKDQRALMHPVVYASLQTTAEEARYHSTELETLAVVWALQKFRTYLIGKKFKVVTDCAAVRWTFSKKNIIPRIARWWLQTMDFDFEVEHRAGDKMNHVDALSRNPNECDEMVDETEKLYVLLNTMNNEDWLTIAQRQDKKVNDIIRIVGLDKKKILTKAEKKIQDEFCVVDGRLYRRNGDRLLWVVPDKARSQIARLCHNNVGHPASENTLERLRRHYWFPYMKKYVKGFVGSCLDCLYNKVPGGRWQRELHIIDKIGIPFHTVHVDHLGPFIKSKLNNIYLFVLIDGFTNFSILKPTKNVKSSTTTKLMEEIISTFGPMTRKISDRGTAYTGKEFEQICRDHNIIHVRNATATPRANGQCERLNRTILSMLTTTCTTETDWDKEIRRIQWSINNALNKATKSTPFALMFGYTPRTFDGDNVQDHANIVQGSLCDLLKLRTAALTSIIEEQKKVQAYNNTDRTKAHNYRVGELVMVMRQVVGQPGESKKLALKYKGPYVVTEMLPHDRYRIQDLPEIQRTQKFYEGVVAIDQMKPFNNTSYVSSDEHQEGSDGEQVNVVDEVEVQEERAASIGKTRSCRKKRKPTYLKDYE